MLNIKERQNIALGQFSQSLSSSGKKREKGT